MTSPNASALGAKEDPRKAGLKKGLRQLNLLQLTRVLHYGDRMALDEGQYVEGKFCPLAVALGLPQLIKEPTNESVTATLKILGFDIYNTKGIEGKFYTDNRYKDLIEATLEVISEKVVGNAR